MTKRRRNRTAGSRDRRRTISVEPLEDRRMLSVGATVPWIRYEAEDGVVGGAAVVLAPGRAIGDPAGEASGRQAVTLQSVGDFVEWQVTAPANALVMRVCIPDAVAGGGIDSSIAIYRNGTFLQNLSVTSRYAWLYGDDTTVTNNPASGPARRIYDESRTLLSTPLVAGDTIRVQKDAANSAASYHVDLVELENVVPLAQPANSISITDKGAIANDGVDDTAAIVAAIADAKVQGKTVWMPAGQFRQSQTITVSGVAVQGAGMWYTELWGYNSGLAGAAGDNAVGFNVAGGGTSLSDFRIVGERTIRRSYGHALGGVFGTGSEFRNLWIEHTETGAWVGQDYSTDPGTNLLFSGLRIRNTFADGINLCNGTVGSTIVNCTARNTGDDSFAMWSVASSTRANSGNVIRNSTSECTWKAAGLAVYGGADGVIEDNLVADTLTYAGITIAASFNALPFSGTTTIRNNTLVRCGGVAWNQEHGAIWVYCDDRSIAAPINVTGNRIVDAAYSAFEINASARGNTITGPVTFTNNVVDGAESLLWVAYNARGTATWQTTTVSGITGLPWVQNDSQGNFVPVGIGNVMPPPGDSGPVITVRPTAVAGPAPVTMATLSVRATDDGGEAGLRYTWAAVGPAAVSFSANGTAAARDVSASFSRAGTYTFTVTVSDGSGQATSDTVSLVIVPMATHVAVSPAVGPILTGASRQFTASVNDQFGIALAARPAVAWSATGGAISASGLFVAGITPGTAVVTAAAAGLTGSTQAAVAVLGSGGDVGAVGLAGSDSFTAATGVYSVTGGGTDIWYSADSFRYVRRSVQGDLTVVARVTSQSNTDPWAKAGIMIRESAAANARFVDLVLTPGNGVSFQWRSTAGTNALSTEAAGIVGPIWLKLTRTGNRFAGFTSTDGATWQQVGSAQTVAMPTTVTAGLAVTAHNNGLLSTATFDNVAVLQAVNAALRRPVAASTTSSGTPAAVVDGNPGTGWTSGTAASQWIRIDLGRVTSIQRIRLDWGARYGTAYAVEVSATGSTWTRVATRSSGVGGVEDLGGLGVSGRFVRLIMTSRSAGVGGYVLQEAAVYGA